MPLRLEAWNLAVPSLTARSRLYSLAPIGIGTAFVESLSGYVERLAGAHAVSAGSLIGRELFARPSGIKPINMGLVSYAINGVGGGAKRWVQALETVTSRPDLRYLTLLPFERLFPKPFIFRPVRAWCPPCYQLMATQGGPAYEPLLWCLKLVEVCPRHHRFLTDKCPHCLRSLRPLTAASRPGFCSRCGLWLGSTINQTVSPARDAAPTEYQRWLAESIGELLASVPQINPERLRDRAREVLVAYANTFTEGNRTAVADMAGCGRGVFYSWFKGDQVPRIDTLLRTWYQLKLPVACLVDDASPGLLPELQAKRSLEIRSARETTPKRSPEQIHRALEAALQEEPAPSLTEIARRLGYGSTERVRSADSDLCRQIVLRHRKSGRSHWWRRRGAKPICELSRIRKVLEEYLASDGPIPPLDRIAADLGYAADGSLRQKLPELCCALSAKIAEQKRMRLAAIKPALEQALQETPAPTLRQMAKRLGFSAACVLKAHAPALYDKLKARWQTYAETCRAELRAKLLAVLEEGPPPSLKSVYARFGVTESIVNTSFPELRREIGLRHLRYQRQQAQGRRDEVRAEIREIVRMLHAQGICPSVPRVTSRLKCGSLREWRVVGKAVNDARAELMTD
jgi:TniQ